MNKIILRDAIYTLDALARQNQNILAYDQAVRQFNALLKSAKAAYPERDDIQSLEGYDDRLNNGMNISSNEFSDAVDRLKLAVDLRPFNSPAETFAQVELPPDAPDDVVKDMQELEGAISLELTKTSLLLAGSIAEALLLSRHPSTSKTGPGLNELFLQARNQRLFGRDTLRNLETLVEYRDLIHPRAEKRNQTFRSSARMSAAIVALKLLCHELEDTSVRYD